MKNIKQLVEEKLNQEVLDVRILNGGMSNYNYLVKTKEDCFVVRIPGENAEKFVDRDIEKYHIEMIKESKVNQEVHYFDASTGIKISKYIEGKNLGEEQVDIDEVVNLFKSYHQLHSDYDYNPFERIELFESYLSNQSQAYFELRENLFSYKDFLESQEKVFCHNDAQPLNIIKNSSEIKLLDWEFAGNNDPMYDIVCFTEDYGANKAFSEQLIKAYFGELNTDLLKRKLLWSIFQSLQWYNVALFKDNEGMSEKLKIDFIEVCDYFIKTTIENFEELRRIENES